MIRKRSPRITALLFLVVAEGGALTWLAGQGEIPVPLLFIGYGVAFAAYLGILVILRRAPGPGPLWLWFAAGLLLRGPWLPVGPSLSDDVWRYLHDGRAQVAGVNPYRYPPSAPEAATYAGSDRELINNPGLPTIYPPAAQWAFRIAVHLGGTLIAWKLLLLIFDLGIAVAIAHRLRVIGRPAGWAAIYLLHPLPVLEFAGNAHVDALGIVALVAALAFAGRRWLGAGIAFATSVAAKYLALPVLPLFMRHGSWRQQGMFALAAAATLAVLYAPFLDHPPIGSLGEFASRFTFNGPIYAVAAAFTSPTLARVLLGAGLLGLLAWLWRRAVPVEQATFVWIAALLLLSPIVHPWYVLWLLPFLAWRRAGWALAWTGSVVLSYAVLPGWRSHGVWQLPTWALVMEYAPVYGLLAWQGTDAGRRLLRQARRRPQ